MSIASGWETETPLEAGVFALSWARQAERIHEQERQAVSPDGAAMHRVPGAERASHYGPRIKRTARPQSPGVNPLGPLAGSGFIARVAREQGRYPILVGVPFRNLPVGGFSGFGASGSIIPQESTPSGSLLHSSPFNVANRRFRIGLVDAPETAPATPQGTESLTVATHTSRTLARYLKEYADVSPIAEARRWRAEADAYAEHAGSCESQIIRTLSWALDLEQELEPVPPFAPIAIPAQLRIAVGPY